MRIIKLSPKDPDMIDRISVDIFFSKKLPQRKPPGQFLLTKGRIAKKGIAPGEMLIFSYGGEIVYLALSQTERLNTTGLEAYNYPYYFCIDVETIAKGTGNLRELELAIKTTKHIVRTQGWPFLKDSPELKRIWEEFRQ